MRLFIGIRTPCENELISLQQSLRQRGSGRFTDRDNLHMTLKFLGEMPPDRVKDITGAMEEVDAERFFLECRGAEMFNKSGIVSARVDGDMGRLMALFTALEDALAQRGFARETRALRPHITLARGFRAFSQADLGDVPYRCSGFEVGDIILFESRRDAGRLVYVPLYRKRLGPG